METLTASTGAASGKIVLTWNLPNGAVAGDISSYLIETSTNGVAWSTHSNQSRSINGQNNTINVDITGLTDSQNYFFRVSAVTSAGTGAGAVVSAVPTGPPAAPTGLGIVANAGQAIVSWIPPNYIGIIATFDVEYRVVGTTNLTSISVNGTTTSANISGLINGTAYEFRVRANGAVAGNWTSFVQKTPYSAPSGIGSFSATPGAGEVVLKWLTPFFTANS